MRSFIALFAILLFALPGNANAQGGCTDPTATNYNPSATSNDGSCLYAATHYNPALRAAFGSGVPESSGLIWSDGKLWTHNDSGNPASFFSVDTATGAILQTVFIDNFPNTDWENITADSAFIYVGNTGNNNGTRTDLKILKVAKADITTAAVVHVNAQAISFSYTDQTSFASSSTHNFDCEAMISIRDSLYLFTKDRGDSRTRVYKMPKTPGTYAVSPYTSFAAGGLITDAAYNPATKEVVLIGYLSGHLNSFIWFLNDYKADSFFTGNKRRVEINNGVEWQTEGITFFPGNRFLVSCEVTNSIPASFYVCNRNLTQSSTAVNGLLKSGAITAYPNPVADMLHIDGMVTEASYLITGMTGQVLLEGKLASGAGYVAVKALPAGNYTLTISPANGDSITKMIFTKK